MRQSGYALITGASDGIGRAIAHALAREGTHLVLVARRGALLDALAAQLKAQYGIEAHTLAIDLASRIGVDELIAATVDRDIGLLVAAAGYGISGPLVENDAGALLTMCDVNCGAVLTLTHAFARRFSERGSGAIVLFGSLVGWQGAPYAAAYAATKAFIQALAEGLAVELAPRGVAVLACAPGPVRSGFADRAAMVMGASDTPEAVARAVVRRIGKRGTLVPGRLGKFLTYSLLLLPRALRVQIMARIMRGMTRDHEAPRSPSTTQPA